MLVPDNIEELGKSIAKTIEELEQENKCLHDEKANLLDIEAKLQARVSEELVAKKQENEELRLEIENLKQRCEKLTQYLNKQTTKEMD
jgi:polyhydroxyalkanoate synthesis regulator phasin